MAQTRSQKVKSLEAETVKAGLIEGMGFSFSEDPAYPGLSPATDSSSEKPHAPPAQQGAVTQEKELHACASDLVKCENVV